MAYYSSFKSQVKRGNLSEQTFTKVASSLGYSVSKATLQEDKYSHIDFFITYNDKTWSVDVKTVGKLGFTSELINNWGYPGSLHGKADFIAYIDRHCVYLLSRTRLITHIYNKLNITENQLKLTSKETSTYNTIYRHYKLYTRPQWKDCWLILDPEDIKGLASKTWNI